MKRKQNVPTIIQRGNDKHYKNVKYHIGTQVLHVAVEKKIPGRFHPVAGVSALPVTNAETLHRLQGGLVPSNTRQIHFSD